MSIQELEDLYDFEFEKALEEINKLKKANPKVLLQFPEGMKPIATQVADLLEEKTKAKIVIWLGTCFGACDIPQSDADLIIQFGHAPWKE